MAVSHRRPDGATVAITHHDGEYHAMANECPHQGPLGEGSIKGRPASLSVAWLGFLP